RGRAGAGKGDSMRRAIGIRVWFLSILLMGAAIPSRAQDAGSVTGVVSDQTGAVLVGADVTLENPNSKIVFHAKTNSVGSYTIPNVPTGSGYRMTFSIGGFATVEYKDVY